MSVWLIDRIWLIISLGNIWLKASYYWQVLQISLLYTFIVKYYSVLDKNKNIDVSHNKCKLFVSEISSSCSKYDNAYHVVKQRYFNTWLKFLSLSLQGRLYIWFFLAPFRKLVVVSLFSIFIYTLKISMFVLNNVMPQEYQTFVIMTSMS